MNQKSRFSQICLLKMNDRVDHFRVVSTKSDINYFDALRQLELHF